MRYVDPTGRFGLASVGAANSIRMQLTNMQVNVGFGFMDAAMDPENAASNIVNSKLLGIASLGGSAAFKLMRIMSGKFRKSCNSFNGKTLVATEFGLKPIADIQIGDRVWAYSEETGEQSLQDVVHLIQSQGTKELVDITLTSGGVITATAEHPLYLANTKDWVLAKELTTGSQLLDRDGQWVNIHSTEQYQQMAQVYNLTVANDHTYYVGERQVLGHNSNRCSYKGLIFGEKKPSLYKHKKHQRGGPKGKRPAGIEPEDSIYAFERWGVKHENGNWYARSSDNRSIYRYFSGGAKSGDYHWSGRTGDKRDALSKSDIPPEIIKYFGFKVKGKKL